MTTPPDLAITRDAVNANMIRAAAILRENGFCRGWMVDQDQILARLHWSFCRMCPRGAFAAAAGAHPRYMLAESGPILPGDPVAALIRACELRLALWLIEHGHAAAQPLPSKAVVVIEGWADEQWRTTGQVIDAVTSAAGPEGVAA